MCVEQVSIEQVFVLAIFTTKLVIKAEVWKTKKYSLA